ncbi:hypothetical protein A1O7_03838 [Cladophialophora yegresii CBS 114405]|uniref:Uncharacterized protein n=1 Tax=Cladophialophora yegresii CBS 114405 TaxID=1182544 RepID=W9VV96_9EURO|nr:uncharacterized protein A1O7_03838 [Cladophialophora yegresii CBS 114405]EXJ59692.1 hypothetical protein A1O7_03838 [Cladophialophora yegresii CBS 114405]
MAPTKTEFSTPDIPQSAATFYASARTLINAPASLVFRTLRNTETWKDWNRWCPRVTITAQPDDEDDATLAEIEELVRNTSIAVNFDSDITDGAVMSGPEHSSAYRRKSKSGGTTNGAGAASPPPPGSRGSGSFERPRSPPPVTRQRLASNASRLSGMSQTSPDAEASRSNSMANANANGAEPAARRLSAAQVYQAASDSRRGSLPNSVTSPPAADTNGTDGSKGKTGVLVPAPNNPARLMPAPANTQSTAIARRKSTASSRNRRQLHINALYGEPSVRIQLGTKMTLHLKMKLPASHEVGDRAVLVTEVSRPDDPLEHDVPIAQLGNLSSGVILRTQTHTDSVSGVYRLVWTSVASKSCPRFLLFTQRVHEIRPTKDGAGQEICEYWDWECQRGVLAKRNAKTKAYMEERMAEWGTRLGEFCESMGGAVERRDFVGSVG